MKIKETKKGNIKLTLTREQVGAVRNIVGYTNPVTRKLAVASVPINTQQWTPADEAALLSVFCGLYNNPITGYKGL